MTKSTRPTSPPVIGLIGSIGAGKSTVAQMLADAGCVVSDSDALARESFHDPAVRDQIIKWWGASLLDSQGKVDRSRIAEIVFPPVNPSAAQRLAADQERKRLEGLVHPWIHARRRALFAQAAATAKAFVIDAPLLLESNIQGECDALLMVDAPLSLRLERVRTSRGWVSDELIRRENSQMPLDLKRKVAHHIVNNDGSIDSLRAQVAQILSIILDSQPHHC
ncbi:MAG: dephospho-CoA kinase [Planctomycetota bacterium]|nr:dephospho-CoA kinase [Planctomycetota bacterium]